MGIGLCFKLWARQALGSLRSRNSRLRDTPCPLQNQTRASCHHCRPKTTLSSLSNSSASADGILDTLLQDVTVENYDEIGMKLGVRRWAPAASPITFPVTGMVWGEKKRIMLPMQCYIQNRTPIIIPMLLDTGAPTTYLCADTLTKLGFTENTPSTATVVLHGYRINITLSHNHFANNDLLGADWLEAARACLHVDYGAHVVVVKGTGVWESLAEMGWVVAILLAIILLIMSVLRT